MTVIKSDRMKKEKEHSYVPSQKLAQSKKRRETLSAETHLIRVFFVETAHFSVSYLLRKPW